MSIFLFIFNKTNAMLMLFKLITFLPFFLFWIPILLFSQSPGFRLLDQQQATANPWTHLEVNNQPGNFQFAIVTDRTGGHRPGVFMDAVHKLNLLQPEFVMSVGDLIEGYTEDTTTLAREWEEFEGFVKQLEMPFFYVPGNHDITNKVMDAIWKKRFGQSWYSFMYQDVLFLCLNSEDQYRGAGRGTISEMQYQWIKERLEAHPNPKWTLVFLHQPLWHQEQADYWQEVEVLLQGRKHTVFAGHEHRYVFNKRNNGKYFTLATTGGGSYLRGPALGEFDHVVWVTMTEQGPIIANLQLDGIWGEDLVTPDIQATINKAYSQHPIKIWPVLYSSGDTLTTEFESKITLINDEDVPMKVTFEEAFNWDFSGGVQSPEITIAPNVREEIPFNLHARKEEIIDLKPFKLKATVSWDVPGQKNLSLPFSWFVMPEEKKRTQKAGRTIQVDGLLDDWMELPLSIQSDDGAKTVAHFQSCYDSANLYIAVRVADDKVDVSGGAAPWTQDYIGMIIDSKELLASAMDAGDNWFEQSFYLLLTPEAEGVSSNVHPKDRLPENLLYKCLKTEGGFQLEVAVPLKVLEAYQGKDWSHFRFNLVVGDKDGDTFQEYWYHPTWRSDDNRIGSGFFFRE